MKHVKNKAKANMTSDKQMGLPYFLKYEQYITVKLKNFIWSNWPKTKKQKPQTKNDQKFLFGPTDVFEKKLRSHKK